MLWETSLLDPEEGIRFRGFSIPELQVKPTFHMLSCLLTGHPASPADITLIPTETCILTSVGETALGHSTW